MMAHWEGAMIAISFRTGRSRSTGRFNSDVEFDRSRGLQRFASDGCRNGDEHVRQVLTVVASRHHGRSASVTRIVCLGDVRAVDRSVAAGTLVLVARDWGVPKRL
jgi:hypothetical protein